ncbi:MAG: hypothetical protein ACUVS9_01150, partial [Thermaceae bacterium]
LRASLGPFRSPDQNPHDGDLNVSVAAAVILFEAQRQRIKAGFYEKPRLSPEEREALFQDWLSR